MPEISCGHCGGTHGSVAEVRECALGDDGAGDDFGAPVEASFDTGPTPHAPERAPTAVTLITPGPPADRGPLELGRSLVVPAGSEVPEGWDGVPHVRIDEITALEPGDLVDELHGYWSRRQPYIVHLDTELFTPPHTVVRREPWFLGPDLELPRERLFHLVWSNSLLVGPDGSTSLPSAAGATRLGASPAQEHGEPTADLVLSDSTTVTFDGGPLDLELPSQLDVTILHTIGISDRSLHPLQPRDPDAELADDQLRAVAHAGGPARIVAPAGSGKTRVLTERARHLLRCGLPADALTLVAFNKRAQLEMEARTTDLPGLRVRTLNALALAIINGTDGFRRSATMSARVQTIDEREVRRLLRRLVEVPRRTNTDPLATWIEALSAARLGLRDPAAVVDEVGPDVRDLERVLENYRILLARQQQVDFDEQILRAIEILLADPEARRGAQQRCQVLLIDEFQDLTPAHMLLVRLLAGPRADVFGVGDDDQTIDGFTGASPEWLIDYERWFPGATPYALEVNYRCAPAVVEGATALLRHNQQRVLKTITSPPDRIAGGGDNGFEVIESTEPLQSLADRTADLLATGAAPSDIVILARVNVALAAPQVALSSAGVAAVHAVTPDLLQRTGVRALLAWLRLAHDPGNMQPADVAEAVRRPSRGLSQRVREWMGEHRSVRDLRRLGQRLGDRDQRRIDEFLDDIEQLADLAQDGATTADLFLAIGDDIGVAGALGNLDGARRSVDRSTHLDDLDALVQLGGIHTDAGTFTEWLQQQLHLPGADAGQGVTLSTVHRVKGLEWPHVIVVGANEGTFPHRLAETEEERRVFHVAITRSSLSTTVIGDVTRPSRFGREARGDTRSAPAVLSTPSRPGRDSAPPSSPASSALVESLKTWRRATAKDANVPAYVVFSDATLDAIVDARPKDRRQLGRIKGIGPKKLDLYADEVLALVADSS